VIIIDSTANTLDILNEIFSGLLGTTTASHIHCCTAVPGVGTAGVATTTPTFAGFPLGVNAGSYSNILDMTQASSWNPAFITAEGSIANAEAALVAGLNIHSSVVPGGEIRGFLVPAPEPGTMALSIAALAGLFLVSRARSV
jgi:hypothetical protein